MVLKRKRSDSEMSTSSSLFSSPLSSASRFMSFDSPQQIIPTPSLFPSRTRKRYRNNRPSESEVHQHTLSLLFGAQQQQQQPQNYPQSSISPSPIIPQASISAIPGHQSSQQSSLHSFWALPNPRDTSHPTAFSMTNTTTFATSPRDAYNLPATHCEDCSVSLHMADNGDSIDADMMALDGDEANYSCTSCGKQVCHGCAVSNLGADRKCLSCAKPKEKWQGGRGWLAN